MTAFRRINGRIVPIRDAAAKGFKKGTRIGSAIGLVHNPIAAGVVLKTVRKPQDIAPNRFLQGTGLAAAVADGLISGATLFSGGKKFLAGQGVSAGLSVGSSAANVASYAGKDHLRERARGIARQEAVNTLVGYGAFAGVVLANPVSRRRVIDAALKAANFFKSKIGVLL